MDDLVNTNCKCNGRGGLWTRLPRLVYRLYRASWIPNWECGAKMQYPKPQSPLQLSIMLCKLKWALFRMRATITFCHVLYLWISYYCTIYLYSYSTAPTDPGVPECDRSFSQLDHKVFCTVSEELHRPPIGRSRGAQHLRPTCWKVHLGSRAPKCLILACTRHVRSNSFISSVGVPSEKG